MQNGRQRPSSSLRVFDWINFFMAGVQVAAAAFVSVCLSIARPCSPTEGSR
jgi:hypothetical protein